MLTSEDLSEIQKLIQKEIDPVKKDIKTLKSDATQIRRDVKIIVNFFDKEYLELRKRVERIEDHLNLPSVNN